VFSTPGVSVCINEEYIPHILGALEVLTVPEYWDQPQDIIPQIEILMDRLAGDPDDCTDAPTSWCGVYDFAADDYGSIFSGLAVFGHGTPAHIGGTGWALSTGCASGGGSGTSAFMVLKATFPDPITIDYVRISWATSTTSDANATQAFLIDHVSSGGNDGAWAAATGSHALDFDGTDTTAAHTKTDTEHFFEVQLYPAGGSSCPSGIMLIREIQIYGTGDAPPGAIPC